MAKNIVETDRGWVDLSNLVHRGNGQIDWVKSIGKTVDFKFDDIISTLTLVDRAENSYSSIYIDIPGYVNHYKISICLIKKGQLNKALNWKTRTSFKYEVGDIIEDLLITGKYKNSGRKYYNFRRIIDGYEGVKREELISEYKPLHRNKSVITRTVQKGCNDIATTRPDVAELFYDKNDAFIYSKGSKKRAYFKCPRCGNKIYALIKDVTYHGLSCKKCSDGISYPNKFMFGLMEQISDINLKQGKQIIFEPEKRFEWSMSYSHENKKLSGPKIYDMYIPGYEIIIEAHGNYHYRRSHFKNSETRTLEEITENDIIKRDLAISNGIQEDHYIVLDCSKSNMEHIKKSIVLSNLPSLLGFSEEDIDWGECNKFATSSRVYEACMHWNSGIRNYKDLSSIMSLHYTTVARYIARGKELGFITD